MARRPLPHEVKISLIDVCGRAFWYKQPLFDTFARAGIPDEFYLKYEHEAKFKIARQLLGDLEQLGDEGFLLQRRLLTEMCKFRDLPDNEVPDREAGLSALRTLKESIRDHDLAVEEEVHASAELPSSTQKALQEVNERQKRLKKLYQSFTTLTQSNDPQARGYELEDLLRELFAAYEIRYRKSYKADGEQVDGFFSFGGFDYIVEARWRKRSPTLEELAAIRLKVDRKIESTRGFVVSITPYDEEILRRLREAGSANLVLMDGYDLALILEGRVSLVDALQAKIDKAAQEGVMFFSIAELFA